MQEKMRSHGLFLWFLAAVGCAPGKTEVVKEETDRRTPVETRGVAVGTLAEKGDYFGTVEPRTSTTISAEVPGKVVDLRFEEGQAVREGELLVAIDDETYKLAEEQASNAAAAAALRVTQVEEGLAVQRRTLQANVDSTTALVEAARARLSLVEKGARSEERKQMSAALELARVGKENANIEYERVKALAAANAATQQMLDGARAGAEAADARYEQAFQADAMVHRGARAEDKEAARAMVKQAEAGLAAATSALDSLKVQEKELEAARIMAANAKIAHKMAANNLAKAQVKSPVQGDAVVAARFIEKGEMAAPGMPLFELLDMRYPRLVLRVPPADVRYLKEKQAVTVTCVGDEPNRTRPGQVEMVSVQANPQNTTFAVKVRIDNADGSLRAGQVCQAQPDLARFELPIVPRDAVLDTMEGKAVMVVEGGKARERMVKLAAERDGLAAVSEGLKEGDRVIVVGERSVQDGDEVNVRSQLPPASADASGQ
jgi:RND family efflux transporter MFP subunit